MQFKRFLGLLPVALGILVLITTSIGCSRQSSGTVRVSSDRSSLAVSATEAEAEAAEISTTTAKPAPKKAKPGEKPAPKPKGKSNGGSGEASKSVPPNPKADIDSNDAKYASGPGPDITANGKPVTITYRPPHMFGIGLKEAGKAEKKCGLTFATMMIRQDDGDTDVEVHLVVRETGIRAIFKLRGSNIHKGETWTTTSGNIRMYIKMLDFRTTPGPLGPVIDWLKIQLIAKPKPAT